jgi:hypothetical protein
MNRDGSQSGVDDLPQFAGCYFVAAQPHTTDVDEGDRLFAHAPGVFEKLYEMEDEIEWTPAALTRDTAYRTAASFCLFIALIMIAISILGILGISGVFQPMTS